jgi:hypothetical protein
MYLDEAMAATATLLAVAFALCTTERWIDRRRRHERAWTAALALFAAGSAALWAGASLGWGPVTFRLFYLFGAVVNVPVLALGTVELLGSERQGRFWTWIVVTFCAFSAGVILAAPLTGQIDAGALPQGSDVLGPLPRVLAAVGSSVGALVVAGGAAWSVVRLWRHHGPARLAVGNLLILAGTVVLGAGGLFNSVMDAMAAFSASLVVGIALLFAGFLVATSPVGRARLAIAPEPTAGRAAGTARTEPAVG